MAQASLSNETLREALDAVAEHGSISAAARALKIPIPTLGHRYRAAVDRGLDQAIVHPAPGGHKVKGVSTLYTKDGKVVAQWVKTRTDLPALDTVIAAVREAFSDYTPPVITTPANPVTTDSDLATVYPLADLHLGLLAWHRETGEDWDLPIARQVIADAMRKLVGCTPPSETAVILGLGDLLHADNYENRTSRSGHVLDVDGRHPKVLKVGADLVIYAVDLALQKHRYVIVRLIPGNHDDQSAVAVSLALSYRYASDPRVTVDDDAGRFWWWQFGKCFLGAAHGDMVKMPQLPLVMASINPTAWGETKHRFIFTGHIHRNEKLNAREFGGVEVESFSSPAAKDAWSHGMGFTSGRSVHAITFHRENGEESRSRVAIVST